MVENQQYKVGLGAIESPTKNRAFADDVPTFLLEATIHREQRLEASRCTV